LAYDVVLRIRRFWAFREVEAMWQQLSQSEKWRFGVAVCLIAIMAGVLLFFAARGYRILALTQALVLFHSVFLLYVKLIKPALSKGDEPRAVNPSTGG
jgi:hypothetical protein